MTPSSPIRDEFERLYTQYEQDDSIRKQRIKAVELFSLMMQERASTGRIYIQNVDHCNTHSPFDPVVAPVRQSNLCLEIALPTKPLEDVNDENGEIALCTLSAFNLGLSTASTSWKSWRCWRCVLWMRCSTIRITPSRRLNAVRMGVVRWVSA
ncbi:ribonucleotide reductase of class Ia [Klebsiella pneumoniae]|uniref:Ribonucleotide reductase of class Ia n=1 Tax=Klebsiella pneumoniae TaxID=573 RepID=A0A377V8L8_KLEPN|nr:ribonucleotide reductase of class Ia [Klebsiella pneumoniae]